MSSHHITSLRIAMKSVFVLLSIVLLSFPIDVYSKDGAVRIEGRMMCNGVPVKDLKLSIYDKNKIIKDNLWNTDTTDQNGFFSFSAAGSEWFTSTDPYLYAEHKCNTKKNRDCYKILRVYVPDVLITEGKFPNNIMKIGDFELGETYKNGQMWLDNWKDYPLGGIQRCFPFN